MDSNISYSEYQKVQDFCKTHFNKKTYRFLVSKEIHEEELSKLNNSIREENFYFVIDLIEFKITHCNGMEMFKKNSDTFNIKNYFDMFPKSGISNLLTLLGKQTFLLSKSEYIKFLSPVFIVQIPLRLYPNSDELYLVKRSISPWQITECGQITSYLSSFTIIKKYDHEEINPRFIGIPEFLKKQVEKYFAVGFNQLPSTENKFAPKEISILHIIASDLEQSSKEIAKKAGIKLLTLNTYNRNIIHKAKLMFGDNLPIKTTKDVAIYLKKNGLFGFE